MAKKAEAPAGLTAQTPLDGVRLEVGGTILEEVSDLAICSLAIPLDGDKDFTRALKAAFGLSVPAVDRSVARGETRLLGLQQGQFFLLFPDEGSDPVSEIRAQLGETAYMTDQSDGWVLLRLSGPLCLAALARICPLDLDPAVFPPDAVARTLMEHLGVVILREAEASFLLMSARSSASSFLHAVETSLRNVVAG